MEFSVLMSVYKKENPDYLQVALDSILNQTRMPSQIVVVKDGQLTEALNHVIDIFVAEYPSVFTILELPQNLGLGLALQEGIKKCRFELVARMDSDDISLESRFEKQLKLFEENPDLAIVGSSIEEFDSKSGEVISYRNVPVSFDEIFSFARKRNPFNHMTVMYRKSAVLEAGNYKDFMWFEDYYLWVRMLAHGAQAYNISEPLVRARADLAMFERRGGWKYARNEYRLQKEFLAMGFISKHQFVKNSLMRIITRLIPNFLRRIIYIHMIRK